MTVDELLARYPRFAVVADQPQYDWLTDELIRARHVAVERDERNGNGRALVVRQYIAFAQRRSAVCSNGSSMSTLSTAPTAAVP